MVLLSILLLSAGCVGSCSGPQQLTFFSPWGRSQAEETSVYKVTATAPSDEELSGGYRAAFYLVSDPNAESTYTTTIRQNDDRSLTVENVFTFTGTYYDNKRNPIRRKGAPESESATVTDRYTSSVTFHIVWNNKDLFRAVKSERTWEAMTKPVFEQDGSSYLQRTSVTQTIEYGNNSAVATLTSKPVPGWEGADEYFPCSFGKDENGNPITQRTYTYGENDLVIDNELYLYFLRSLSANPAFAEQNVTPNGFSTISPLNDMTSKNNRPTSMRFAAAEVTDLGVTFSDHIYADDPTTQPYPERTVTDGNGYHVSVMGASQQQGQALTYDIFRDGGDENYPKETKVRYATSDGGFANAVSLCRILQFDSGFHMHYELLSYVNKSPKASRDA